MHQPITRKVELYKPRNGEAGTETCRVVKPSSVKTKEPPSPCGFTYGIAVYGPVCTVVWEGRAGNRSPYPDLAGWRDVIPSLCRHTEIKCLPATTRQSTGNTNRERRLPPVRFSLLLKPHWCSRLNS